MGLLMAGQNAEKVVLYEEGGRIRKVKCEVEVISWRERVKSKVQVDADVDSRKNSLCSSRKDMVKVERVAEGTVLAY
ncbi:hypothetical protein L2E82_02032 [Cichorium intybus]|uniref:Uncharacterized protein n=1 Tax=Cichorium intybus TaxID=13427 RepID=A0ACB9H0J0_CICIN|nr:hypothetical protein L2E82_02032 [Cichorium intybus]